MLSIEAYSIEQLTQLEGRLIDALRECASVQEAAQTWTEAIYRELSASVVLTRSYATFPFTDLPSPYRDFATRIAEQKGARERLQPRTLVLCLLGSAGVEHAWNDAYRSWGHLAIPLIDAAFVDGIPMVARLLNDMGVGLDWLNDVRTEIVVQTLGRTAGLFYVADAISDTDYKHRIIVADQEFVERYGIHTVFGIGGSYETGTFLTQIFFCREPLTPGAVIRFQTLINTLKSATVSLALSGKVFRPPVG